MFETVRSCEIFRLLRGSLPQRRLGQLCLSLLLIVPSASLAESFAVKENGKFKAFAFFVKDKDWRDKWFTPSDEVKFDTTSTVRVGDELTFLVGFANPARNADGQIKVLCDLEITKPDGSSGGSARQIDCASPDLPVSENRIVPTYLSVAIKPGPDEPVGETLFEVTVIDAIAGQELELELTLTIEGSK